MSQSDKVMRHLENYGSITPMEAVSEYGIYRLAAVVHSLRRRGAPIATDEIKGRNRYGERIHYARYRLEDRPGAQ